MIVGRENLIKLFPDFADDVAENGIDLRVGTIFELEQDYSNIIGCIDDRKMLPEMIELKCITSNDYYKLRPNKYYIVEIDRPIHIPDGYTQLYKIRSTFARCGLLLVSAVGDNDFNGTLKLGLKNLTTLPIYVGKNERIIQAVTFKNDGTASKYNGSYQNDKIYKE